MRKSNAIHAPIARYVGAISIVLVAAYLGDQVSALTGGRTPFITLFPAIIIIAIFGGLGPGLLAVGLSAVLATYLWMEPRGGWLPTRPPDIVAITIYIPIACLIVAICVRLRSLTELAWERARVERERLDVLMSIDEGFCSVDSQNRCTYLNPSAERTLGLTAGEVAGKPIALLLSDVFGEAFAESLMNSLRTRTKFETEVHLRKQPERILDVRVYPSAAGAAVYFRDTTERRSAERKVAASEAQLRLITDSLPVLIAYVDREQRYRFNNKTYEHWTTRSKTDLAGKTVREILGERVYTQVEPYIHRVLAGERVSFDILGRSGDEPRELAATYVPHITPGGVAGYIALLEDATERKRAEARNAFLVRLSDAVRPLSDPDQITLVGATLLGEHLGANRCAFADVEEDQDTFNLTGNYCREVPSIVGRYKFSDFGQTVLELMRKNEPYVVSDIDKDAPPEMDLAAYRQTKIQAVVCVPLHKGGRFVAAMAVHQATPREWMPHEIQLVQIVANRCWESMERARAMRALRRTQERLHLALEAARLGDWSWDASNDLVTFSERGAEIFGIAPGPVMTWTAMQEMIDLEDREVTHQAVLRAIETRSDYSTEYRVHRGDGTTVWVAASGRATYAPDGTPVGMTGVVQDVTERKQVEAALREREGRFRVTANSAPVLIWIADEQKGGEWFNRTWLSFTGRTLEQERGEGWLEGIHPEDRQVLLDVYHTQFDARLPFETEYRLRRYDGDWRWVKVSAQPLNAGPGNAFSGYIGSAIDITDLKQAAAERQRLLESERGAREQAENESRLKDEFLATLSHELRTPLNAILGWCHLMMQASSRVDTAEGLRVIQRNAKAQAQLIEDLLDMSRVIAGKVRMEMQRVSLADVVTSAYETIRPAADAKEIHLLKRIDPDTKPLVLADANRLQQVFWNLLNNAVKFTPRGGTVEVMLTQTTDVLQVAVKDTGEGISPEFLPYVFHRFRQADGTTTRKHGGLGLGLSIVKHLVELHGGHVRVDSPGEGQGATFYVMLPAAAEPAQATAHDAQMPTAALLESRFLDHSQDGHSVPSLEGIRVLVVDDDHDGREFARQILTQHGAQVVLFSNATDALTSFIRVRPDVLLSDIGMPGTDGYELIRKVRQLSIAEGGTTPAIALTAFARAEDRRRAIAAGYHAHQSKPVDPEELVATVRSLARSRRDHEKR